MIYKIEEGMYLDFVRINPNTKQEEIRTIEVLELGNSKKDQIKVRFIDNNKIEYFWFETLRNCRHHLNKPLKSKSALSYALDILKEEQRPIHIDELCELIFEKGYKMPRNGKTFKNTISTSLNKECYKPNSKIKKIHYATFVVVDWKGEYEKGFTKKVKEDMERVFG